MKLGLEEQLKQFTPMLSPKQQTLDFVHSNLWQQLAAADCRACCEAIAALLVQVTLANQENNEHEG
jgi:hypothetical protein